MSGREVSAHALTHVHPDQQGALNEVCAARTIPFLVPAGDAAAAEDPRLIAETTPDHPITRLALRYWAGPAHRIDRVLREGDEVAGLSSSTCRDTRPDRSPTGANRTASSSSATC